MKTTTSIPFACIAMAVLAAAPLCQAKTKQPKIFDSRVVSKKPLPTLTDFNSVTCSMPVTQLFCGRPLTRLQADTAMMTSHYIVGETPSGSVNGTNKVFTLLHAPLLGKDAVYLNGILQVRGTDYTISSATITMTNAPFTGDRIRVIYYY